MTGAPDPDDRSYVIGGTRLRAMAAEPRLYLVATPIGNLGDITLRALETLAGVDLIACEDTRVTRVLLQRYGIRTKTAAYHEHNAASAGSKLLGVLKDGGSVALVSDAGTPLVSDPGYRLVSDAIEAGHRVVPIPGASALLAALTVSGLPTDTFLFAGFLPAKDGQRRTRLRQVSAVSATLVFYESPRRLAATLRAMAEELGAECAAAVGRELTKTFEEVRRGTLGTLAAHYGDAATPKGEIVICVQPDTGPSPLKAEDIDALLLELAETMPASKAAGEAAKISGQTKQVLFKRLVELKDNGT